MELPVAKAVPLPHPAVYQYTVPCAPLAVSVVPEPLQTGLEEAVTDVGLEGEVIKETWLP